MGIFYTPLKTQVIRGKDTKSNSVAGYRRLLVSIFLLLIFSLLSSVSFSQTSWTGTAGTTWANLSNWTAGIPTSAIDAIIGDRAITNQPVITATAVCKSLTIGGTNTGNLTLSANLTVSGNITINSNGTLTQNSNTLTLTGNWSNTGIYTGATTTSSIVFGGAAQLIAGTVATNFRVFTINAGSTVTMNQNFSADISILINGTLNPSESPYYLVSGAASITVSATGVAKITAAAVTSNYGLTGAFTLANGSTVDYSSTTTNQTVYALTYSTLKISGTGVKSIAGSLVALVAAGATYGNLTVAGGTLDLGTFTADRGTTVAGGTLSVADGATLKIGGINSLPLNYATKTFSALSTVEFSGTTQTISSQAYGNLIYSGSGTLALTSASTVSVAGNATISSGTLNISNTAGTSTLNITGNLNFTGGTVNVSNSTGTGSLSITGNLSVSAGVFNVLSNASSLSTTVGVSGNLLVSSTGKINLETVSSAGTAIINVTGDFTSTGTSVAAVGRGGGVVDFGAGTITNNAINISGNFSKSGVGTFGTTSTTTSSKGFVFNKAGTQTFTYSGANSQYIQYTVNSGSTLQLLSGLTLLSGTTPTSSFTVNGSLNVGANVITGTTNPTFTLASTGKIFTANAGGLIASLAGTWGSRTFTAAAQYEFNSSIASQTTGFSGLVIGNPSAILISNTGGTVTQDANFIFGNSSTLTVNSSSILSATTFTSTFGTTGTANINGALKTTNVNGFSGAVNTTIVSTNNPVVSFGGTGTIEYNGAAAQTITAINYYNLIVSTVRSANITLASAGTIGIAGLFTPSATFTSGGFINTTSTIDFNGASQNIPAFTYNNLNLSGSGTKTALGIITVQNNFSLSSATFVGGAYNHLIAGNWTMSSGAFTNTGTTITLNGAGAQTISSTGAFNNLTVNKVSGSTTMLTDVTVNATLSFILGKITSGTFKVILPSSGTISGAAQATGWVFGNLQKYFSTTSGSFEIGSSAVYSPISMTFASITTAGSLIASATNASQPNVATSAIIPVKNIVRYWTLSYPGSGALVFTTVTLTFNWNVSDNYSPITAAYEVVGNYYSAAWSYPTISGTPTTSSIVTSGVSHLGDFTVGEPCNVNTAISYAGSPFCSTSATVAVTRTGTALGTYTSTAGLTINSGTGLITPATSTAGTYVVTYTITAGGGCPIYTTTTSVTITATPSATISYAGSPFCSIAGTGSVTRTGTAGGTYSALAGLSINSATGAITTGTSTAGAYVVTYTVAAAGGCSLYTTTTSVTITATPSATLSYAGSPFCSTAGTGSVTQTGTAGGTYSALAGLTINSGTGAITTGTSTAGTYVVTYTVAAAGGCSLYTTTTSVTITAAPSATISYAGSPFCSTAGTGSVTRTGTASGTYSALAGLTINFATGAITTATSTAGTYVVTYTVAAAGGCSLYTTTTSVTITATPSATISYAGSPFCSTAGIGSVTQTGTAGGTYSALAGLTINPATGAITTATSTAGTYVVTYTVAAAGGCSLYTTTTSVTITVTPSATISYAGSPFCSTAGTGSVTRTGTAGGTYSALAGLTINFATGAITTATSTSGTYVVTYTVAAAGGCSLYTTTTSVTITAAPSATISYAGSPFCSSVASGAVSQSGTSGGSYSSTGGLTINPVTGAIAPLTSTAGTYVVTYTVSASGGCSLYTTTTSVTITATPAATISYAGSPFCSTAGAGSVTRTGTAGGTYSALAGLTINSAIGAITTGTSTAGTYVVTYTVAAAGGCSLYTTTTSVTITAAPSATISYAGSPFCTSAGTGSVTFSGTAGGLYSSTAGLTINSGTGAITTSSSTAGTYVVTYTVAASGGCSLYTTTTSVTITAAPSATISYPGTPYCSNAGTAAVTFSGTAGGTYSALAGLTINSATGDITTGTSTAGTYTITYTVATSGGCASIQTTTSIVIIQGSIWTGTTSTVWHFAGNWNCGGIPSSTSNVTIPSGLTNYPVVSHTEAIHNLTIQSGASVTVTDATLSIAGSISNSGTFTASGGTVELNGTSAQSIPANTFASNTISNLTANNSVSVTLSGTLNLTGILSVNNGQLITGGFLTLKSSAITTALVGPILSSASTPISGNVVVERYIPGRRKYRMVTSSVTTSALSTLSVGQESLSIWGNWQNSGVNTTPNIGSLITGGTSADGFDTQTANPSLFTYNDATKKFVNFSSANGKNTKYTPLKAGIPYYMFVYGDRRNSVTTSTPNPTVLTETGTLLTGDQYYDSTTTIRISPVVSRFSFLGNPFACIIDWKSVTKNNVSKTIWGWDANLSSTGGYVTVTATANGALVAPLSSLVKISRYIQLGQGFFVQTTAVNPQVLIAETDKITDTSKISNNIFSATQPTPLIAMNLIYNTAGTNVLADGVVSAFDNSYSNSVTDDDATKMIGSSEGLAIQKDSILLSIEARQMPHDNDTLFLNVSKLTKPQYTLQVFAKDMENSYLQPFLVDAYMNTVQSLSITDTNNIVFTVNLAVPASFDANRFKIVFRVTGILPVTFSSITAKQVSKNIQVQWTVSEERDIVKYEVERSVDGVHFAKAGEVLARGSTLQQDYEWLDLNPASGDNYYRIKSVQLDGSYILSRVVVVKMGGLQSQILAYPNPITRQEVNIRLTNMDKEDYQLILFNWQGQKLMQKIISHPGGTSVYLVRLPQLSKGAYAIKVYGKNESFDQKVFVE